ncbi:MAG: hypothetical protein COX63_00380 [Candidatus Diapherotrites archaeon CG_4_10_14_0_2_um_filter_31_5]|nr:MAG: hypothetical protein COX63_00380 [Candidatus Diapherotrites archaeon CG_4_10_14_0_2_um_filter_31_5]
MFNKNELKRLVEKESKDFYTLNHINRCFNYLELIKEKEFDEEIVDAGILLHFIGFSQSTKFNQDLIQTSLNLAKKFLSQAGFPAEKQGSVLYCIEESGLKGKPKSIESILVHDVNLLDEISSIGLVKESVLFNQKKISLKQFLGELKTKSILFNQAFFSVKAKKEAEKGISLFVSFVESLENNLK